MGLMTLPVVDLQTRDIVAQELLMGHARHTFAVARQAGVVAELEQFVLQKADELSQTRTVLVNVSTDYLRRYPLSFSEPERVVLEVTEHGRMEPRKLSLLLAQARCNGLRIAVDDFGNGSSGVDRCQILSPDFIKWRWNEGAKQALPWICDFANALHAEVIAERIETEQQAQEALRYGIRLAQGIHLGRPTPIGGEDR